jgi:cell division protein FtsI/penicillin-binding protein 2
MVTKKSKDTILIRARFVTAFFLLCFTVLAGRLFYLQTVWADEAKVMAQNQHGIYQKLLPIRGEIKIVDRSTGETYPVATNIKQYLVYAVPQEIKDPQSVSKQLGEVLVVPEADLLSKVTQQNRRYVPLKKQLTEDEQTKIRALNLPGIYFDEEGARFYPEKNLLSQTIGFVGYKKDVKEGLYGLERYFQTDLAGKEGELRTEKDASGAWIFGADRDYTPVEDGVNLILTVDKSIQHKAETVLKKAVEENQADGGSVVVLNPKTGAVLAMATYPGFDLNEFQKVEDLAVYNNEVVMGAYEPGSVVKPLTLAAAINEGKITPETTYTDTGSVKIDQYEIKNSDNRAHGVQTMTEALEKSLNTGMIFAKEQIGNKTFFEYLKKFGFGQASGVELLENKGNLDNLKANILINFHTASFGQGISVTPIQLVQAFTAIANGGKMMKPFLVQSKIFPDGRAEENRGEVVGEPISSKTANTVAAMMVNVVENGHGKRAQVPGYYIAGKTGTAQVPKKNNRGYEENNNIGSFIGFGPVEDPKFLALVRINHPRTVQFAESTAAPAFGELADFILHYYQVKPNR